MKQTKLFGEDEVAICEKIPLAKALKIGENVRFLVSEFMSQAEVVGSARRKKPYCKDIDIVGVATPTEFEKAIKNIQREYKVDFKVKGNKVTKLYIETAIGKVQVDLYATSKQTFGLNKLIRTGSAKHNQWLATYAISKGFRIKYQEGLLKNGEYVAGQTEEEVFNALGVDVPEPSKREIIDGKPFWFNH